MALLLGLIPIGVSLALFLRSPQIDINLTTAVVWLTCLSLFILSDMLAGRVERGLWAGYLSVSVMVAWLTLGVRPALGIVLVGAVVAAVFGERFSLSSNALSAAKPPPRSDMSTSRSIVEQALSRITISGLSLLTASATLMVLGGRVPLRNLEANHLPILAALFAGFVVTQVVGVLLIDPNSLFTTKRISSRDRISRVFVEILLLGLAMILSLILYNTGLFIFVSVMALVAILAARYHQVSNTQQALLRRVQELSMLNSIGQAVSSNLLLDELLMSIYTQVSQLIDVSTFYIALYDEERETLDFRLVVSHGKVVQWPTRRLRRGGTHDQIIRKGAPLRLDVNDQEPNQQLEITLVTNKYLSFLGVPLTIGSKVLGVMAVISDEQQNAFGQTEIDTLQTVASQAGLAIRNATLYARSAELAQQLQLINQSVQDLLFNLDSAEAMDAACATAISIVNAQRAAIYILDAEHLTMKLMHAAGLTTAHEKFYTTLPYQPDTHEQGPRVVVDTREMTSDVVLVEAAHRGEYRAFAEIPLRSGSVTLGLLIVYHNQPHYYRKTELNMLSALANQVTAALDNAQLLQALELYASEMGQLMHLSRMSTSSLQLEEIVADIQEILCDMVNVNHTTIALREPGSDSMRVVLSGTSAAPNTLELSSFAAANATPAATLNFPEIRALTRQSMPRPTSFQRDDTDLSAGLEEFMARQGVEWLALMPMVANNDLLGAVILSNQEARYLTSREWQLLETATNQIATQVYNAQVYSTTRQELNRRLEQLSLIEEIAQQISSSLDFNLIIHNVLEAAIRATHADVAALALLTEADEFWIINHQYVNGELRKYYRSRSRDGGVMGQVARTGKIMIVPDNHALPNYSAPLQGSYLSSIAAPLLKDGLVLGVLNLESTELNFFTEEQASFLSNLAGHAVISIDNARLLEERQHQVDTLISLRELSLRLSSVVDTDSIAYTVVEAALRMSEAHKATLFRYDETTRELVSLAGLRAGGWNEPRTKPVHRSIPNRLAYSAVHTGELQVAERIKSDTEPLPSEGASQQNASMIAIPIKRQGRVHEVLCVVFEEALTFQERDLNTLSLLAIQAAGHLENATLHERIRVGSNRMRVILDSTRDGVILLDNEGRLVEANPAASQLISIKLHEQIGQPFTAILNARVREGEDTALYSPPQIEETEQMLQSDPETMTRREFAFKRFNETMHVEEVGAPVRDAQDRIVGRLLVLRDITEEKLLAAYRDEIMNMAVHDLRGPLSSIINGVQIALEDAHKPEALALVQQTLTLALNSAHSLMGLVNTMLDIAKLKRRQMPIKREQVPAGYIVQNALAALLTSIQMASIETEVTVPDDLEVFVDEDKIRRVLINLIDNAIRFTPTGGRIQISAEAHEDDGEALFRVADSGPGIPLEERERVFDDFVQIRGPQRARGSKGTGLGLTFCKLAVEAHDGHIWVAADGPLSGACLAFTLPMYAESVNPQTLEAGTNNTANHTMPAPELTAGDTQTSTPVEAPQTSASSAD